MKISSASWVKIIVFIFVGVVFGGVMVMYSNSQYQKSEGDSPRDELKSMFGSDESGDRHIEKSFTVRSGGNLLLDTDAGDVDVETWDRDEVMVKVDIAGTDRRAEKFEVKFSSDADRVTVSGKSSDNSFFKWDVGELDINYHITVPKKFTVKANTSGGNMALRNLEGDVRLETSGGNLSAEAVDGIVTLNTSGGNLTIKTIKGAVKGETSGGNIRADHVDGDVNVQTSGGDIDLSSIDGSVHAETSGGGITLRLSGENKGIDVHSSGGDINIYMSESVAANLEASTSGGKVRCELPITVKGDMSDEELRGKINGGGNVIRAETSGGDVKIKMMK
jgi:DUF4097 and DUF4098 domain-containing protein YvlB